MCIYILRPASILKLNSKSHFIQTHGRITFPQSRNPLSSQKVRKNHFQSIKKHNAKKYIYMETIFIQKKERRKIQKNTIHPRSKPRFDNKKRKRTHSIMEDRQGESPVISLDSSETQSRMEIQPTPWAADSPSPTRSARACLTRDSARVSALDRSHPILHAGKRSIIRRKDDCFLDSTVSLRFRGFNVRACWVVIVSIDFSWETGGGLCDKLVFFPRSL